MRNRFFVFFLGCVFFLMVLEAFLGLAGFFHSGNRVERKIAGKQYTILCEGDSFTAGSGAEQGNGYPPQLENIFKARVPAEIKVVNRGIETSNTAMVLKRLGRDIDLIKPDILVILVGGSNLWNSYGYGDYLGRHGVIEWAKDTLYKVKVFRLISLLVRDAVRKETGNENFSSFAPVSCDLPDELLTFWAAGVEAEREGKYDDAVILYKKSVKERPSSGVYIDLGRVYAKMKKMDESRAAFKKAIETDPLSVRAYANYNIYFKSEEDILFIQQYERISPPARDLLKRRRQQSGFSEDVKAWIVHDVERMIDVAEARGIPVVLQTYPDYMGWTRKVNVLLRDIAMKRNVLLVDHERIFDEMFRDGHLNISDYFSVDKSHCNTRGYGIMAESIYRVLTERNRIHVSIP